MHKYEDEKICQNEINEDNLKSEDQSDIKINYFGEHDIALTSNREHL